MAALFFIYSTTVNYVHFHVTTEAGATFSTGLDFLLHLSQSAITCSKLTIESLEKGEICSKLTLKTGQPTNWLSVFDHFVGLSLKGLSLISSRDHCQ